MRYTSERKEAVIKKMMPPPSARQLWQVAHVVTNSEKSPVIKDMKG